METNSALRHMGSTMHLADVKCSTRFTQLKVGMDSWYTTSRFDMRSTRRLRPNITGIGYVVFCGWETKWRSAWVDIVSRPRASGVRFPNPRTFDWPYRRASTRLPGDRRSADRHFATGCFSGVLLACAEWRESSEFPLCDTRRRK